QTACRSPSRRSRVRTIRRARMNRDGMRYMIAGLLVAMLGGAGIAAATTIAEIVAQPGGFANAAVTVTGTVTAQRLGFAGESLFPLEDAGKRVTVLSKQDAPAVGSRVEVDAKVGFRPPDEEFTWPPLLLETARRSVP